MEEPRGVMMYGEEEEELSLKGTDRKDRLTAKQKQGKERKGERSLWKRRKI